MTETEAKNTLVSIKGKQKKEEQKKPADSPGGKKPKPPKLNGGTIEKNLIRYLETGVPQVLMPDLPYEQTFKVWFYRPDSLLSTRMVLVNEQTGTAEDIGFSKLTAILHKELEKFGVEDDPGMCYCLSQSGTVNLANRLLAVGRQLNQWPEPCGFKSTPGYVFERLSWDPVPFATPKDFPFISEILSRMGNSLAFCQRVGSIFVPGADRKQAVILYGLGDAGKTAIFNMLKSLVGKEGYAPITEGISKDSFGLWTLKDKRLWIGEEIEPAFFRTNTFKRLTGGAPVLINPKGEKQFSALLQGMLFVNSNEAPAIPNDSGLLNRLIICRIDPVPEEARLPEEEVNRRVAAELPYFVGYCLGLYKGGRIHPEDATELESAVSDFEAPMAKIFDAFFEEDLSALGSDATLTSNDFASTWEKITGTFPGLVKEMTLASFRRYVCSRVGREGKAFSVLVRRNQNVFRVIPGLKLKSKTYSSMSVMENYL